MPLSYLVLIIDFITAPFLAFAYYQPLCIAILLAYACCSEVASTVYKW